MSGPPQNVKVFEVVYTNRRSGDSVTVMVLADSVMGAVDKFIAVGGPEKANPLGGLVVRYLGDVWG